MNWKNIIGDLVRSGLTQKQLAEKAGLPQSSVSELIKGTQKTVKWEVGETLIALHRVHCQSPAAKKEAA